MCGEEWCRGRQAASAGVANGRVVGCIIDACDIRSGSEPVSGFGGSGSPVRFWKRRGYTRVVFIRLSVAPDTGIPRTQRLLLQDTSRRMMDTTLPRRSKNNRTRPPIAPAWGCAATLRRSSFAVHQSSLRRSRRSRLDPSSCQSRRQMGLLDPTLGRLRTGHQRSDLTR